MLTDKELDYLYEYTETMITLQEALERIRRIQMSVQYACFLLKKEQVMPKEIISVLVDKYKSGCGLAVGLDGELEIIREQGQAKADSLAEMLEGYKEAARLVWFLKSDNPVPDDSLQPFTLVTNAEGKAMVAACLIGKFDEYEQAGSSNTNEYHAVDKRIRPKVLKLWKSMDSDLVTFTTDMESDNSDVLDTLGELCPEEASIIYITASGKMYAESKPEDREKELGPEGKEWGWSYGNWGEDDKVDTPVIPPQSTMASKLAALRAKATGGSQSTPDTSALSTGKAPDGDGDSTPRLLKKKDIHKDDLVLVKKRDSDEYISTPDDAVLTRPPKSVDTKDKLHGYFNDHLGYVPRNWKDRPWHMPKQNISLPDKKDLKNTTADVKGNVDNRYVPPPKIMHASVAKDFISKSWPEIRLLGHNSEFIDNPTKIMADETKDKSAAAMLNEAAVSLGLKDVSFVSIKDTDMGHAGRARLLSLCSGPHAEQYIALCSAIWRDNMYARISIQNKCTEYENRIKNMAEELDKFRASTKPEDKKAEPAAPSQSEAPTSKLAALKKGLK